MIFKEGTVVVIKEITERAKKLGKEERLPYNLITEIQTFHTKVKDVSVMCVLGLNQLPYSIREMISVMKMATDREAFLYHLEGKPFVLEE